MRRMEESEEREEDKEEWEDVRRVSAKTPPFAVQVKSDGVQVDMEVDTGASVSLMSELTFKRIWPQGSLNPHKSDWERACELICTCDWNALLSDDINVAWMNWKQTFLSIMEKVIPRVKLSKRNVPWLSAEAKRAIKK